MTSCTVVMIFSTKKVVHFKKQKRDVFDGNYSAFTCFWSICTHKKSDIKESCCKRQRKGVTREDEERIEQVCSMRVMQKTYLPHLAKDRLKCAFGHHTIVRQCCKCSFYCHQLQTALLFELTTKSHISSISPQTPVIAIAILASPQVQACEYVLLMGILQ